MNYSTDSSETIRKLREKIVFLRKENEELKTTVRTLAKMKKPAKRGKSGGPDTETGG